MKTLFSTPRFAPPVIAFLLLHGFAAAAVTFTTDTFISVSNKAYDGLNVVINNCTLTVDGSHSFASLQVLNGGDLTHSFVSSGGLGLNLIITGNVTVTPGGRINVDGRGYDGGAGPGAGRSVGSPLSGSGAGHGGYGGQSVGLDGTGLTYDTIQQPTSQGSGGGRGYGGVGGAGGGSVKLVVGGTMRVDGSVTADGADGLNSRSGGGSGGSIWLSVQNLTGTGLLSANGGAGEPGQGGGGGGGRISIQYASNSFYGPVVAHGGSGYAAGGAGTIYSISTATPTKVAGQLLVDNGGLSGTNTPISIAEVVDLTVQGAAVVSLPGSVTFHSLLVASNAWLSVGNPITIIVTGDATIQEGGGITADGAGYASNLGPGAGKYAVSTYAYTGGGGGYGGFGAAGGGTTAYGGVTYGSVTGPMELGSGGGCSPVLIVLPGSAAGSGGGSIQLSVRGMLLLDGRISADGTAGVAEGSGGGSGGSVWLSAGTIAGAGTASANGGMGNGTGLWGGGGGGGGRIAVYYGLNLFFGVTSARGGGGSARGGAGTIYNLTNPSAPRGHVLVDNGGQSGTNTTLGSQAPASIDLTIRGGAVLSPPSSQTFTTLLIGPNGWLSVSNQSLTVFGDATIQSGGGILADGAGFPSGQGPGAGRYMSAPSGYVGGGGGYGGYGGGGLETAFYSGPITVAGGNTYGSVTAPADLGSGGGGSSTYPPGGSGGGAVRLTVTGTLQVDGSISAAGKPGAAQSAGGGSGGTISLTVGALAGSGTISANGGMGSFLGGGGGGGRIAVVYSTNVFSGLISAYGGGGYVWGGAGMIYTKANNQSVGLVTLDNGGQSGTNTSWGATLGTFDLVIKGGAVLAPAYQYSLPTFRDLLVATNGWLLLATSTGYPTVTITGDATVQAGGGIIADGTGLPGGQGTGAGRYSQSDSGYVSSGGGHGGYGGASGGAKPAPGGIIYDSLTEQASGGSGGGTYLTYVIGGAGGASIRLNVTGALLVNGRISAAGLPGASADAGGGSGGSIWLTAGTLSGSGVIAANGGDGNGLGGGGGGGRISLRYNVSSFSGVISAYGGGGYARGGAGTIYTRANNQQAGQVIVDNGGQVGTNTGWSQAGIVDLTITGGAVVSPPGQQTLGNLLITSNGWLSLSNQSLTVLNNATIQTGGGVIADGTGYPGSAGPGAGGYGSDRGYIGGGGGYGGYGAVGAGGSRVSGGSTYGSATAPTDRGSGGGSYATPSAGGAGGGMARMTVTGALLINGRISANGAAGFGQGGGGGSGGSVWLTAGSLAGAGIISANGGAGNELGGGGGGGRVSVQYGVNAFEGIMSAYGGGGSAWGGAGTIYTKASNQAMGRIVLDNAGHPGTNTPLAYLAPFDLTIKGGAVGVPSSGHLSLSNLFINASGFLSGVTGQTNLDVAVLRNATIDSGGAITADGKGFAAGSGPGAGRSTNYIGSGAGYGGNGGASAVLPGGNTYGSAQQPVDRGSGGGLGLGTPTSGSEGGGAIRLTVGGTLLVNGRLSADGNAGLQDDAGGGSGGSLWLTAGVLAGAGTITADGGEGELYDGGGGGGGRIAIYSPLNVFDGVVSAAGGDGASPGQPGSIYYAGAPSGPQVVAWTPVGTVTSAVASAEVEFSTPVDPYSISAATLGLTPPDGLAVNGLAVAALTPCRFQVTFPAQTALGDYAMKVGPQIRDLLGSAMSSAYTGTFEIAWAVVQGSVTDTNGLPVPGVVLQPDNGAPATTTDANGNYVLSVPPGETINVVLAKTNLTFVPSSRTYVNVTAPIPNENYVAVGTVLPALTTQVKTNTYILNWYGITGVTYQTLYSTNLVDWQPYDVPLPGTNGPLQLLVPMGTDPIKFFRVGASY